MQMMATLATAYIRNNRKRMITYAAAVAGVDIQQTSSMSSTKLVKGHETSVNLK
jgi:hypothetical protein